jgi:FtsZ-interacting cell division protein ZipA
MLTGPIFKYLSGGLAIALLIFIGLWKMEQRRAGKLADRVVELTELRKSDRASYEAAQREAELRNKATVQKIEERNEQISDRVRSDYQRDLQRLRDQSKANRGSPGGPGVSGVPKASGGVDGADQVRLPPEQLLRAQEIELQLKHLIDWVRGQSRPTEPS